MKKLVLMLSMLLLPVSVLAQSITSTLYIPVETTNTLRNYSIKNIEATSLDVVFQFTEGGARMDLSSSDAVTFRYVPDDGAWQQSISGSLVNSGTNGEAKVALTPVNSNTNGTFNFVMLVSRAGVEVLGRAEGELTLDKNWGKTVTNAFPAATNVGAVAYWSGSGWSLLPAGTTNYVLKTLGEGIPPVWSPVSAVVSGVVTNIVAGTNIVITGTSTYPIINDGGAYIAADVATLNSAVAADATNRTAIMIEVGLNSATGATAIANAALAQATADYANVTGAVNTAGIATSVQDIIDLAGTQAVNTAGISDNTSYISDLASTQVVVKATADGALQTDGSTPMTGNLNGGGQDATNFASISGSSGAQVTLGDDLDIRANGVGNLNIVLDGDNDGGIYVQNLFTPILKVDTNNTFIVYVDQTNEADLVVQGDLNVSSNLAVTGNMNATTGTFGTIRGDFLRGSDDSLSVQGDMIGVGPVTVGYGGGWTAYFDDAYICGLHGNIGASDYISVYGNIQMAANNIYDIGTSSATVRSIYATTGTFTVVTGDGSALTGVGDFLADGSTPMTGDLNGGGQDATNFLNVVASTGTFGIVEIGSSAVLDSATLGINVLRSTVATRGTAILAEESFKTAYVAVAGGQAVGSNDGDVLVSAGTNSDATVELMIENVSGLTINHDRSVSVVTELRTGGIADQGAYDLQAKDAIITNDLTVGETINMSMGKYIVWVQDASNSFAISGLSSTQGVSRFTRDGVVSNVYWNMISD